MLNIGSILFGLLVLIFAAWLITSGIEGLYLDHQFETSVGRSTGTVLRLWTVRHRRYTEYDASYTYTSQYGPEATSQWIFADSYNRLQVGESFPVKYLLEHTGESRIDRPEETELHWLRDAGSLAMGICFFGGLVVAFRVAMPRSEKSWENAAIKADLDKKGRWL